jgi:hypothetical protein
MQAKSQAVFEKNFAQKFREIFVQIAQQKTLDKKVAAVV